MDILKAFELDGKDHNINILWENDKPLFRASEIGDILKITKIRNSISSFDDEEKVARTIITPGGRKETLFLIEMGYKWK
jgi:prophage antirepressor-like protein